MKSRIFFFACTIFLSSFLLFQVQPIISKYILPWFGGTSAVWTTAMLFFQTALLLGYSYTLLLSKLSVKKQIGFHSIIVLGIGSLLLFLFSVWQTPILPDISWKPSDTLSPILQVLLILSISVGLPYFLLSTTSILLQKWFGIIQSEKSPYPLYALSNIASLLALVSYPVIIEPFLPLHLQGIWWAVGFICYAVFLLFCCGLTFFSHKKLTQKVNTQKVIIKTKTVLSWLLLSSISTLMLLAITNMLTQSIAPIPFLWLLPLSLYLLSFIICFSGKKLYWRNFYAYLFLLTAPLVIIFTFSEVPSLLFGIVLYSVVLFSCVMMCHGELYHRRPAAVRLDTFYFFIALGSVVSGIFIGVIAPLVFKGFWEIYIGFYLSILLGIVILTEYKESFFRKRMRVFFTSKKELYLAYLFCFPVVLVAVVFVLNRVSGYSSVQTWRDFYGVVMNKEKTFSKTKLSLFMHGNIIHGSQFSGGPMRYQPTTYFGPESGVGLGILQVQKMKKTMHVGITGLGIGTLAAYGRKGDIYTFYEINPQVADLANNQFTYLKDSHAKINIILGDGRLAMQKVPDKYDIIILDAFSDDAIPVHLLTKEAFIMYLQKLVPDGVIAVNISNNYVNLKPLLYQVARRFDLQEAVIRSHAKGNFTEAEWVLLTKNKAVISSSAISKASKIGTYKTVALWTDDYSNLFQLLK